MLKVINIVGARPNFMKIAPLVRAFGESPVFEQRLVHTGQHYDPGLSDIFFQELGIPAPDVALGVGSFPREEQIAKIEELFEPVLVKEQPDLVLVVGDVNSTVACARVARKHDVKVAHVEAGLRSFDLRMPEEHNRIATDKISDFLYVTEQAGLENLAREQVPGRAELVGNVMIDTLVYQLERARKTTKLSELGLTPGSYIVSTFHRPSNVDSRETLEKLLEILELVTSFGSLVLPLHPRTQHSMESFGLADRLRGIENLHLTPPLGYLDFIGLVASAKAVVTDSGGIQEETTYLGIPCLTMRENTERPVTIDLGSNMLIGSDLNKLRTELERIKLGRYKKGAIPPLWDGHAAERIVRDLAAQLKKRN
ncbi:MAG: UDP-N-acetylglucosamine 2-epimerase (non-hydrolyzing) [Bdellovibrionota bacterium]